VASPLELRRLIGTVSSYRLGPLFLPDRKEWFITVDKNTLEALPNALTRFLAKKNQA
jgi:hypothetical protein